jgi:DNA ligase-1
MEPVSRLQPTIAPGVFVQPSGARLESVPNDDSLDEIWKDVEKLGSCYGYPKPDGWRLQIHKSGDTVKVLSRRNIDYTKAFPSLVRIIRSPELQDQVVLDTELVGFNIYGQHLEPSKLRSAAQYHCYLLDALFLNGKDLTAWPTRERVPYIRQNLDNFFSLEHTLAENTILTLAGYTLIETRERLVEFYRDCRVRKNEGFDGAIIKWMDANYFDEVLKLKPEDTVDAVIVGAYLNDKGAVKSLLLAVPHQESNRWIPISKVTLHVSGWNAIWTACEPHIMDHCSDNLNDPPDIPDIWFAPKVVVEVKVTSVKDGIGYPVQVVYARECSLREDKGPEEATSFEKLSQMAGLSQIPKLSAERPKQMYLSMGTAFSYEMFPNTDEIGSDTVNIGPQILEGNEDSVNHQESGANLEQLKLPF